MGVDFDGVGGIGIRVTEEMFEKVRTYLIKADLGQTEDNEDVRTWCDCDLLEAFGLSYSEAGDGCYGGEARFYWRIRGKKLSEVLSNMPEFIAYLNDAEIEVNQDDLEIISDLYTW